ncbi:MULTISPECIES: S8 family serine peptidase [Niastella]|uniref:S8 family serine peptidase n=1 Tax=Niastella soli TaxID=2821487 RepID=A0ABS3Z5P7_9BACT|nr:S8 family serine peptidase [Niastella soli]MBO9205459.1 S8 family serine peptidase [Niastella soli]
MDPRLKLVLKGDPEELLLLLVRLQKPEVIPPHCKVITQFGDIITCRVYRKYLLEVYNSPYTFSVKAARLIPAPLKEGLDEEGPPLPVVPSRSIKAPYSGKGVFFAAVDWGFDFAHANLRKPDGTTRFLFIWDQNGIYDGNKYGYGCFYTDAEINEALQSDTPYQTLGYHPGRGDLFGAGMHGTHVVDIAAGTPITGEGGIAPDTMFVGVELGSNLVNGSDLALGDSVRLVEGLDCIHSVTKKINIPCVINMSLGSHGDSHTGRSLAELAFDNFLTQNTGYALVQSVGNYYQSDCHIHHTLEPGQTYLMEWNIPRRNRAPNEVEIWYAGSDEYAVKLTAPDGELVAEVTPFEDIQILYRGDPVGYIFQRSKEPNTGLNHIDIILDVTILTGKWIIELKGNKIINGSFHAYCERNDASQAKFSRHQSTPFTTTGSVCNSTNTITVGAYNHRDAQHPVVSFSSSGPTAFGQPKPDLLAPGYKIQAACSAPPSAYTAIDGLTIKSGSSMAAPHVSGAIALLFEKYKPRLLPISLIKELLFAALDPLPLHYTPRDRIRAGNGILNTEALLTDKAFTMNTPYYTRPARRLGELAPEEELVLESESQVECADCENEAAVAFETQEYYDIPETLIEDSPAGLVPPLLDYKNLPPAETIYAGIDLGLRKECCSRDPKTYACTGNLIADVEAKTGIFIPVSFTPTPEIDILLYLHGHKAGYIKGRKDVPIDGYWNKPEFTFRELLNSSGKPFILVAPTLGPFSQPGTLTTDKGFTSFINQVLASLANYSVAYKGKPAPAIKSIILAAHSGGGIRMRAIANLAGKNAYADLITECWGFDCTYSGDDPKVWYEWAAANPGKTLYLYSRKGADTSMIANKIKPLPNIHSLPATTNDHNQVPAIHMQERLTGKSPAPVTPKRPIPGGLKTGALIKGAVGKGGQNNPDDVLLVQTLLNGAGIPIAVTGLTTGNEGDPTVLAIFHYQKRKKLSYDGRIDPNGKTIRSLAQQAGPMPPQPQPQPQPQPTPQPPGPQPPEGSLEAELATHPNCLARYKTVQAYKKIRDQVASWQKPKPIANVADYIEEAIQQWNANPGVHGHFNKNFDDIAGNKQQFAYLNLKRLYALKCVNDPAAYFKANIVTIRFFNKTTPAHKDLAAILNQVETALRAAGQNYTFNDAYSFVPRTMNEKYDTLSNHALGKAIDINYRSNPHITNKDDFKVINAVCGNLLPNGFLKESDPDVFRNASTFFQQTFNDAWIAKQTDPGLIAAITKRRKNLNGYAIIGFLTLPTILINELKKAGLRWGGNYTTAKDFMHFEIVKSDECP